MLKKTNSTILHITSEFTKKNFSISSLIFFIINRLGFNLKSKSFASYQDINLDIKRNKDVFINFIGWLGINKINNLILKENVNKNLLIHVHGIWAPIQIYSLIIANMRGVPSIVHPHGMLLNEAMIGGGNIKFFLKSFILYLISIFANRGKIVFIAITDQEKKSIKRFFPNFKIFKINNPIPFDHNIKKHHNIKKKFSFFGRIHKHKNVEFIIRAFIKANLGEQWSLEIYGIADDENYLKDLKNRYLNNKNIKILKPVFKKNKEKIMSESWFNILASKSEVLSLSILEAGILGLPSLVTNNIELIKNDKLTKLSDNNLDSLSESIKKVSSWNVTKRENYGIKVKNFFKKYQKNSIHNLKQKFLDIYHLFSINKKNSSINYNNNQNFIFSIFNHSINLFFPTFLLILMTLIQRFSLSAELGVTISICLTGTQLLSGNARNILLNKNKKGLIDKIISFRLIVSILGIIFIFIIFNTLFNFTYFFLCFLVGVMIFLQWSFEILLVKYEIENSNLKQFIFSIFQIFFIGVVIYSVIYLDIISLIMLLIFYISVLFFFIITNFTVFNINIIQYIFKYNLAFLSSFSLIISSLIWRIFVFNYFEKEIAGALFAGFALGSFLGTFYNLIIGPTLTKNRLKIQNQFKFIFLLSFISLCFFTILEYLSSNEIMFLNINNLLTMVTLISLVGGFIMVYSMHIRHQLIGKYFKNIDKLFFIDVLYGSILSIILPLLYYFYNLNGVIFSYLLGSVIALLIYNIFKFLIINKNETFKKNI